MPNAVFSSNLTYTPGGGGSLTQSFGVVAPYAAISAGTIDVPSGTAASSSFAIPFGGVETDARGLVIKNNTAFDIGIRLNGASADLYHLAPGGLLMHWAPKAASNPASALKAASFTTTANVDSDGTVDFIVLGD